MTSDTLTLLLDGGLAWSDYRSALHGIEPERRMVAVKLRDDLDDGPKSFEWIAARGGIAAASLGFGFAPGAAASVADGFVDGVMQLGDAARSSSSFFANTVSLAPDWTLIALGLLGCFGAVSTSVEAIVSYRAAKTPKIEAPKQVEEAREKFDERTLRAERRIAACRAGIESSDPNADAVQVIDQAIDFAESKDGSGKSSDGGAVIRRCGSFNVLWEKGRVQILPDLDSNAAPATPPVRDAQDLLDELSSQMREMAPFVNREGAEWITLSVDRVRELRQHAIATDQMLADPTTLGRARDRMEKLRDSVDRLRQSAIDTVSAELDASDRELEAWHRFVKSRHFASAPHTADH